MYAQYLAERTQDRIVEREFGFATYRFIDGGTRVYIVDIFVLPEHRKAGNASALADEIVAIARAQGCIELLGTVVPSTAGATASLDVLRGYGMTLHSADRDVIVFKKGI